MPACGGDHEDGYDPLVELERMAFVPPGTAMLDGFARPFHSCGVDEPLLVDVFEVTRQEWERVMGARRIGEQWGLEEARWGEPTMAWPAFMSWHEARDFAARRGMRLPKAEEWLFLAMGPRVHRFPWGPTAQTSVANTLYLGLGRPTPVGTFESGKSPFGCYDMIGNAWEWVGDRVPGYADSPTTDLFFGQVSALGGSYSTRLRPLYALPQRGSGGRPVYNAITLDPSAMTPEVGMRCVAPAAELLWARAPAWGRDRATQKRLFALGARWAKNGGEILVPLLEELGARADAPEGFAFLLAGARAGALGPG